MFVLVDIETTGLDPETDWLLELGILVTDDNFRPLEIQHDGDDRQGIFSALVHPEKVPLSTLVNRMSDPVRAMHEASGLIAELGQGRGVSAWDAESSALEFLSAFDALGQPMAGSSVHFDRGFLRIDMPRLERAFGYRNIDVSTLKELWARWGNGVPWAQQGAKAHRAVADIHATINELDFYRRNFLR